MSTRQGRLLRKYAIVFGALLGGALVASSLVQLYFSHQESQTAILRIERAEASRAALRILLMPRSAVHAEIEDGLLALLTPVGLPPALTTIWGIMPRLHDGRSPLVSEFLRAIRENAPPTAASPAS